MDCSPPGSSVHGSLQARTLECTAIPSSRGSSWPRDQTQVPCITGRFFTTQATREALIAEWAQIPCTNIFILPASQSSLILHGPLPNLWNPDRPRSAIHSHPQVCVVSAPQSTGILQARILEWVAYPFSRGTSQPRNHLEYLSLLSPHTQPDPSLKSQLKWHLVHEAAPAAPVPSQICLP